MPTSKVFFNWQNPNLLEDIYPFRKQKLIEFLLTYDEIETWNKYKGLSKADPTVSGKIEGLAAQLNNENERLKREIEAAIAALAKKDHWLSVIEENAKRRNLDEKSLRFRRVHYLDNQINELTEDLADLQGQQVSFRKRIDWYDDKNDPRRLMWEKRAQDLQPQVIDISAKLAARKKVRDLFDQQDRLPKVNPKTGVTVKDVAIWELRDSQLELENKPMDELLRLTWEYLSDLNQGFPAWMKYMTIHFSGMRYKSAHGSYAEPKALLEMLSHDQVSLEISALDSANLAQACGQAVQELKTQQASLPKTDKKVQEIERQVGALQILNPRKALIAYRTDRELERIGKLREDQVLDELVKLKALSDQNPDPAQRIPSWAWDEIMKYTPLRLQTQNKDWESVSKERWNRENNRWREILDSWETANITGWREKHRDTLDLIVTRAVCNEIAEHIQHLRGVVPAAGLAAKPRWFLNLAKKENNLSAGDLGKPYFVPNNTRPTKKEEDFKTGASILWLEWVTQQPNAWQIATPISELTLVPGVDKASGPQTGKKKVVEKKKNRDTDQDEEDEIQADSSGYVRITRSMVTQTVTTRDGGAGRTKQVLGPPVKTYLRWRHEATVIGVEELIDGKYVLTFETGQIGIRRHRLSDLVGNPNVFVGYTPDAPLGPDKLARLNDMINASKVLPVAAVTVPKEKAPASFGLRMARPAKVRTTFDPLVNGFKFVNRFPFEFKLPLFKSIDLGEIVLGLCGGMCFGALDYYYAERSVPKHNRVKQLSEKYIGYLWDRQLDSLGLVVIPKVIEWMLRSDIDVGKRTARYEVAKLRKRLDQDQPCVLCLVRIKKGDPTQNHQVLATGYDFDPTSKLMTIYLYEPNHPGKAPTIQLNLSQPSQGIQASQSTGEPLRGFFVIEYKQQKPPDED